MRVAIYTIALNEEQFVERWYQSAKDADYLLIADTGSTDKTIEIAESLGINVIKVNISPWRFDDARNAALANIPLDIDYCISLDMDEVITPNWRDALQVAYEKKISRPRYKHVWSWNEDGTPDTQFAYDHIHARKGYRWKNVVHEAIFPFGGEEETTMFIDGLETHHYPDSTKSRAQYLPLLEMCVKEDPSNDRNCHYYGRELYFYGMYEEATQELKRHLLLPSAKWDAERSSSCSYLAKCDPENQEHWLKQAIKECDYRREAWVDYGIFLYEKEDWKNAYEVMLKAISLDRQSLEYFSEGYAWGDVPYDILSIAAYNLEKIDEAIEYSKKAIALNPTDIRLVNNLGYFQRAKK